MFLTKLIIFVVLFLKKQQKMNHILHELSETAGADIKIVRETGSTNTLAAELPMRDGDAIIALSQTSGRGFHHNSWSAEPGKNLTFSVVLEPAELPAADQFTLSVITSLALIAALRGRGLRAAIKWPNDIYVGRKKIAGILIENSVHGQCISRSIVGVGLNVNQIEFPHDLPNPTSVALETGFETDIYELFRDFYINFMSFYGSMERKPLEIARLYRENLFLLDTTSRFYADGEEFEGTIRGVGEQGELLLERANGTIQTYLFKEIEYKL